MHVINEQEIFWQVDTELKGEHVDCLGAIVMLKEAYGLYQLEQLSLCEFPSCFEKDSWRQLGISKEFVRVLSKNGGFPALAFKGVVSEYACDNIVENSDVLHSSRVLKCESKSADARGNDSCLISAKMNIHLEGQHEQREEKLH